MADVPEVGAEEAQEMGDALLLDVREADEWAAGHTPAATWIPMGELQSAHRRAAPRPQILAICRSGGRSAAVTKALNGMGYDTLNVAGGMQSSGPVRPRRRRRRRCRRHHHLTHGGLTSRNSGI